MKYIQTHIPIERKSNSGVTYTEYKKVYIEEERAKELVKQHRKQQLQDHLDTL